MTTGFLPDSVVRGSAGASIPTYPTTYTEKKKKKYEYFCYKPASAYPFFFIRSRENAKGSGRYLRMYFRKGDKMNNCFDDTSLYIRLPFRLCNITCKTKTKLVARELRIREMMGMMIYSSDFIARNYMRLSREYYVTIIYLR